MTPEQRRRQRDPPAVQNGRHANEPRAAPYVTRRAAIGRPFCARCHAHGGSWRQATAGQYRRAKFASARRVRACDTRLCLCVCVFSVALEEPRGNEARGSTGPASIVGIARRRLAVTGIDAQMLVETRDWDASRRACSQRFWNLGGFYIYGRGGWTRAEDRGEGETNVSSRGVTRTHAGKDDEKEREGGGGGGGGEETTGEKETERT